MDSRDSSAHPIHHAHIQHHHAVQHPQPHHGVMMIPQSQTLPFSSNNSYVLPNINNSLAPTTSNAAMMHQQNPGFPFGPIAATATETKPMDHDFLDGSPSGSGGGLLGIEPVKKKRGRPRKYSPDDSIGLALTSAPGSQVSPAVGHLESSGAEGTPLSDTPAKRRGRPPGSGKRQLNALGVTGVGFTPHVIVVNSGEDIISKIMAFTHQGPRTVCILAATGSVCNFTLSQTATSTGSVTYEGNFDIISLSGTFPSLESNGMPQSPGSTLNVSLAGCDGRVLGGRVTGTFKAASLVQIIVGSFTTETKKPKTPTTTPPSHLLNFNLPSTGPSPSSDSAAEENEESNNINRMGQPPLQSMHMYHHHHQPMGYSMNMQHPSN